MSGHAIDPGIESPAGFVRETASAATSYWWLDLITGVAWLIVSAVILQFDQASVTTIGLLVGMLFVFAGMEAVVLASVSEGAVRFFAVLFSVLFFISSIICFVEPESTFVGLADTLGFLFLIVGIWWMVRAFMERALNSLWWLGLVSGILMTGMAFWTAGQFFFEKAYILLVFAGIWALMEGVLSIVRGFEIRSVHKEIEKRA